MSIKISQVEKKFVKVTGGQLEYEVAGNGPVVLCLPSLGDTLREYEKFAPALREAGYRVIVTSLRGMGDSRGNFPSFSVPALAADIAAILDAEQVERAYLVACSVSGASAGLFAVQNPSRVIGLIMFNPIIHTGGKFMRATMAGLLQVPGLGKWIWATYFKSLYPTRKLDDDYFAHIKANMNQPGAMKSIAGMCWAPRIENEVNQIKVPVLAYFGGKDPDFKDVKAEMNQVRAEMPQGNLYLLEESGHYPQREFPELVIPGVLDWLAKHS